MARRLSSAGLAVLVAAAVAATGCRLKDQSAPGLTGPSEYGLALTITATPDQLAQDGASQSLVVAQVRNDQGQPASKVSLRADTYCTNAANQLVTGDFGSLSAHNIVTGSDGRASAIYTAPSTTSPGAATCLGGEIYIYITPLGTNYANDVISRNVVIHLFAPGVILPPNFPPTAAFTFSPPTPAAGELVTFDGTTSSDPDGPLAAYNWDFGDGATASGPIVTHTFAAGQSSYSVTLKVTDSNGKTVSTTKPVTIKTVANPTAEFVYSPTEPTVGMLIQFDAAQSSAAPGRTIVDYNWNFGDGFPRAGGGATSHFYAAAGKYTVVLVVTDDLGNRGVKTVEIEVKP